MKLKTKRKCIDIAIVLITVMIFAVLLLGLYYQGDPIRDRYNGGVCRDCGGRWHLVGVAGHWKNTTYVYECDQCYKTISSDYPLQ